MSNTPDFTDFATQHPNYFPGQYLLEEDFELQHKYLSDRQKYYKQNLHVSGIIEGLEVEVTEDDNKKKVKIKPGSAIDSKGNLIVLKEEQIFSQFDNITQGELYIQYEEKYAEKQQQDVESSFTRKIEIPILGFADKTPDNCVKLAKLTISGDTITPEPNVREYSGLSLPNSHSEALTLRSDGNENSNLAILSGSLKIDGDLTVNGTISGTIVASTITSGELAIERIPELSANKITSGQLAVARIPELSANKITSGQLAVARIPELSANKITSGELAVERIPELSADKITSGELAVERIPIQDQPIFNLNNNDVVPTVGAVYGYIQSILNFLFSHFKQEIKFDLGNDVFLEMVYIPGGSFWMGTRPEEVEKLSELFSMTQDRFLDFSRDEIPPHEEIIQAFYMGKYPVTQEQWEAVMGENPSHHKGDQFPNYPKSPVEQVSWNDCYGNEETSFCHKLSEKLKSQGNMKFRLPSEAEWEYACRAETTTAYYFGDDPQNLSEYAWYSSNSDNKTHPVGEKKPNDFGLYDMHGNIYEFCTGEYQHLRGGNWNSDAISCRSAHWNSLGINKDHKDIQKGLRVVFSIIS